MTYPAIVGFADNLLAYILYIYTTLFLLEYMDRNIWANITWLRVAD